MQKILFYCQHILGIGHLIRSIEIVKTLLPQFQVCLINGGEVIRDFQFPPGLEVINIPGIKTDDEFTELQPVDPGLTMSELELIRKDALLKNYHQFAPDLLIIELFPFGRRRFSFELIPLLEQAKKDGTKIVCSLRDIVVTKQNQERHEKKVTDLINRYFDLILVHGDPNFIPLEISFAATQQLHCPIHYTGYVVQPLPLENINSLPSVKRPSILVSIGGGRFGHDLLRSVAQSAILLANQIPHHFYLFTGPFCPEAIQQELGERAQSTANLSVDCYTPYLLDYMRQADLSISMSGYNTTMNILVTGIPAMMRAFQGNGDLEQITRIRKLAELGRIRMIEDQDLDPPKLAQGIASYLQTTPQLLTLNLDGSLHTAKLIKDLVN